MSNRTLIEINHDICRPDEWSSNELAALAHYIKFSSDENAATLKRMGITVKHFRHHTEPCPTEARLSALQECREIAVNAPIATEMRDADKDVLRSKRDKVHAYSAGLCNASNHMRDQIQSLIDKEGSKET